MNVHKTRIIARREYLAAVRSKSFIIGLVLLPVFMSGGIISQKLGQKIGDTSDYRVAVVDFTPGAALYGTIAQAVRQYNEHEIFDASGRQIHGTFTLEQIAPVNWNDRASLDSQRLDLSNRVRSGELLGFVEIGPDVLKPAESVAGDGSSIRYYTNRPANMEFRVLLQNVLPSTIMEKRFAAVGQEYQKLYPLLSAPPVLERGLAESKNGKIEFQSDTAQMAGFLVPLAMVMMLLLVTLIGTSTIAANVVEEKQQRIAEVLLGCVTPFELMMGKVLGGVGVSLTLAALFFSGAYFIAWSFGVSGYIPSSMIAWFFFFTIVGTLMYGSLFAAAGAACNTIKEVQSFIMPVMLFIALPMFVLLPVMQNPTGAIATTLSFIPLSAPLMMVLRLSIPPGVPAWEAITAAASTLAATVAFVWAAGRIFRVGILMQGKGANYAAVLRWVLRG